MIKSCFKFKSGHLIGFALGILLWTLFLFFIVNMARGEIAWDSFFDEQIVNAIYHAEGGAKAQFAYGIRSVSYRNIEDARQICLNSVRNGRKRWIDAGKPCDLITHIGLRYCPPMAHKLNSNWVKLVKFFLTNGKM